ncbi:SMEK domain-containing protein [Metapseudomonas otitidis]|uniref:SMEK domain-containing protein n=1 Tax=Metapseudomonas otitidis TaxID=319939 RepID=UPI00209B6FA4|nr:SMEK domain-containing protein [Pseudomonas otitidis]MCO7557622.1 SMEK domain-containing protein [Pseudomonas otitidis]
MSTRTEKMLDDIRRRFALIAADIEIDNKSSLFDRNSHMERYFKQVLNAVYGTNLVSANLGISNYPAIDLKDAVGRVAYQVTATNTKQKITNTIKTLFEHGLDKEFDVLNFLVLKNIQGPKISTGSQANVDYEVITIYDLSRIISDIDDEKKIAEIHEIVTVEYIVEATCAVGVRAGAPFKLTSIQRLIDQVGFDPKTDYADIETFCAEVEAFVKELSELTAEQRTILYELVYKCQTIQGDHRTVYITSKLAMVQFTRWENTVIGSMIDLDLIRIDSEFRVGSFDPEVTALVLRYGSAFDLNIFYELKKFAKNNQDLLQKMFISLDFGCLAL